jgi:hypothetical protein
MIYLSVQCSPISGTALLCVKVARLHPLVLLKTGVLNLYANARTETLLDINFMYLINGDRGGVHLSYLVCSIVA